MTNITNLTTTQLSRIITIKEQIEMLQSQIESIAGGGEMPIPSAAEVPKKGRRSAAVRARMAAAQRARWAKTKGTDTTNSRPAKGKRKLSAAHKRKLIKALAKARKMRWAGVKAAKKKDRRSSPAVRAKLAAAARVRWVRARAEGKTTL
jgi:hypothetical protein